MRQSIWGDELYLYRIVNHHDLRSIMHLVGAEEKTPPLGFLLARLFSPIGDGTVSVRLPALVAGLSTVVLVYLLARRVAGTGIALLSATWIALSPFEIFYSTESRAYALVQALCAASTLAMLIAIERRTKSSWVAWSALTALAIYAHYIAVLVVLPQALWALWVLRRDAAALRWILASQVAVVVLFLPWLPDFLEQARASSGEAGFVNEYAPTTWPVVRLLVARSFAGHPFLPLDTVPGLVPTILLLVAIGVGLASLVGRTLGGRVRAAAREKPVAGRENRVLILMLATVPLLGLLAYSALPDTSFLLARNMSVTVPYGTICLAALLTWVRPRPLAYAGVALVLGSLAVGAAATLGPDQRKPDARDVARYIDRVAPPGSVLLNGSLLLAPNGPPSKAVLTYLDKPFVYAAARASDPRDAFVYFAGTQFDQSYEFAFRERRPIVLIAPSGKPILDFLDMPTKYRPYYRVIGQELTPGLAGGYGVRIWVPR